MNTFGELMIELRFTPSWDKSSQPSRRLILLLSSVRTRTFECFFPERFYRINILISREFLVFTLFDFIVSKWIRLLLESLPGCWPRGRTSSSSRSCSSSTIGCSPGRCNAGLAVGELPFCSWAILLTWVQNLTKLEQRSNPEVWDADWPVWLAAVGPGARRDRLWCSGCRRLWSLIVAAANFLWEWRPLFCRRGRAGSWCCTRSSCWGLRCPAVWGSRRCRWHKCCRLRKTWWHFPPAGLCQFLTNLTFHVRWFCESGGSGKTVCLKWAFFVSFERKCFCLCCTVR